MDDNNPITHKTSEDPNQWMRGFPPAPGDIVRFSDGSYYGWPQLRWSFSNIEQLVPTKSVWRGPGGAQPLNWGQPLDIAGATIRSTDGVTDTWDAVLADSHTDGLAVMYDGGLIHESYFGASSADKPHLLQSANKSLVGTVAECLISEGVLQQDAPVTDWIPELADSAWADATVRQVMDMQISMEFHEDYSDPNSEIWSFVRAMGMAPPPPGVTPEAISDVLPRIKAAGPHGVAFAYREPNIFVLGWLVRRASNKALSTLLSELIWQHIGAQRDAYYMVDSAGSETTCSTTLRDLLRFGELVRLGGKLEGKQILPPGVASTILAGGDQDKFARAGLTQLKDWSYRSQWWFRHVDERICAVARGAHGQVLYIDPTNKLVVARFGSSKQPASAALDPIMWPLMDVITERATS